MVGESYFFSGPHVLARSMIDSGVVNRGTITKAVGLTERPDHRMLAP